MTEETFIKVIRKWNEGETGTFDYNGIVSLLKDYQHEIEKQHLERVKIRVHGEELNEGKFEELARPMVKYLCENYQPHVTVIITPTSAELLESLKTIGRVEDYIRD
jgi:hypothetical protein